MRGGASGLRKVSLWQPTHNRRRYFEDGDTPTRTPLRGSVWVGFFLSPLFLLSQSGGGWRSPPSFFLRAAIQPHRLWRSNVNSVRERFPCSLIRGAEDEGTIAGWARGSQTIQFEQIMLRNARTEIDGLERQSLWYETFESKRRYGLVITTPWNPRER
jgi:hypothetical protein